MQPQVLKLESRMKKTTRKLDSIGDELNTSVRIVESKVMNEIYELKTSVETNLEEKGIVFLHF